MVKSAACWIGAICLSIIPLLIIDIAQHRLAWKAEVREELITVVQNVYSLDRHQKAAILDKVFERNQTLIALMYIKSFLCVLLLGCSIYFFRKRRQNVVLWKPAFSTVALMICFILVKLYVFNQLDGNDQVQFLKLSPNEQTFDSLYQRNFKGKVVYIDFWGTTCGPCLGEFRNFTQPLKDRYKTRHDIAYLYVAQGNSYLWRQQIKRYKVEGAHVFVNEKQYGELFLHSTRDSSILMPRYLIINKAGNIVETNAGTPGSRSVLYNQLDKYLAEK